MDFHVRKYYIPHTLSDKPNELRNGYDPQKLTLHLAIFTTHGTTATGIPTIIYEITKSRNFTPTSKLIFLIP